jgi:hypothetical protein
MARLHITYRTDRPSDDVSLGAFAQVAAKRRYGLEALKSEDPEVAMFGAFVEIEGPAVAKDPDAFDEWLMTVETFELVATTEADPSDPPPAETRSDSSPVSPPTSD